jgi:hypothetical protein
MLALCARAREAGDRAEVLRTRISLHLLARLEEREQLLVLGVEREDRHALGGDEVDHLVPQVHQDRLDAGGGVDLVRDLDQALPVVELALGRIGQVSSPPAGALRVASAAPRISHFAGLFA